MEFNLASAKEYSTSGRTQEWVLRYLDCPKWKNKGLHDAIKKAVPKWHGPIEVAITGLERICGPEEGLDWPEDLDKWEDRVLEILTSLSDLTELPPLIVHSHNGRLRIFDGNHRYETMLRKGYLTCWCFLYS
ncbi:MAG: hypothetical protein DWH91_11760 [Planctomycetota bacterium]|nr:MAG: hypothetical protein DWH91_11760 [Planctomycetota bacterium]